MTLTNAQLAQKNTVMALAAACVKINDDRTGYMLLNPQDPEGSPVLSVTSVAAADMNEIQALLAPITSIVVEIAAIAFDQAVAETPPGTLETAPAMADAIASVITEDSGDYTLSLPDSGGVLVDAQAIEADSAAETFLDGVAAQMDAMATHLEIVADAIVNP